MPFWGVTMGKSWVSAILMSSILSGSLLVSSSAIAGGSLKDDYRPQVMNWTGFYLGGHAGLAVGQTSDRVDLGGLFTVSTDYDMSGALGGAHLGYNFQMGHTVLGIEGTWSALDLEGSETCVVVLDCARKADWLATLVGRVGFVFDRALLYGLAGVAWSNVETNVRDNIVGILRLDGDATHVGWVVGAGLEYALSPRITTRIEYNHVDLGSKTHDLDLSIGGTSLGATLPTKADLTMDTIKVGVTVKVN